MKLTAPQALQVLQEYKRGLENFHRQILKNEEIFLTQGGAKSTGQKRGTPYLVNAVWNKHADAMDNYPTALILPAGEEQRQTASKLSRAIPQILEQLNFEQVYSDCQWYKIKHGTGCYGVFYSPGLRRAQISCVNMLRLYFDPKAADIQQSPMVFYISLREVGEVVRQIGGPVAEAPLALEEYFPDYAPDQLRGKCAVIDCYFKEEGRVHLMSICQGRVLHDSRQAPATGGTGLYSHGQYPFVLDNFLPVQGAPYGMGLIGLGQPVQHYIDRLDDLIEQNAAIAGRQRYLVKDASGVNMGELCDMEKVFVHCDLSVDDSAVRPLQANALPAFVMSHRNAKITELKDVLGNRDTQTGGSLAGVTAYSAIVALQEAGNKLSRDVLVTGYAAFKQVVRQLLWLIHQFYRGQLCCFDENEFITLDISQIDPEWDVRVIAQKKNPFTTAEHNRLVSELFAAGAFSPARSREATAAISCMYLDGREEILKQLSQVQPQEKEDEVR